MNYIGYTASNGRAIKWKDVVVVYFKLLSYQLPGQAEENHKTPNLDSWPLGQQSKLGSTECVCYHTIAMYGVTYADHIVLL
jgi:hypothetical protein